VKKYGEHIDIREYLLQFGPESFVFPSYTSKYTE